MIIKSIKYDEPHVQLETLWEWYTIPAISYKTHVYYLHAFLPWMNTTHIDKYTIHTPSTNEYNTYTYIIHTISSTNEYNTYTYTIRTRSSMNEYSTNTPLTLGQFLNPIHAYMHITMLHAIMFIIFSMHTPHRDHFIGEMQY